MAIPNKRSVEVGAGSNRSSKFCNATSATSVTVKRQLAKTRAFHEIVKTRRPSSQHDSQLRFQHFNSLSNCFPLESFSSHAKSILKVHPNCLSSICSHDFADLNQRVKFIVLFGRTTTTRNGMTCKETHPPQTNRLPFDSFHQKNSVVFLLLPPPPSSPKNKH